MYKLFCLIFCLNLSAFGGDCMIVKKEMCRLFYKFNDVKNSYDFKMRGEISSSYTEWSLDVALFHSKHSKLLDGQCSSLNLGIIDLQYVAKLFTSQNHDNLQRMRVYDMFVNTCNQNENSN